jgi:hypothetical protein
MNMRILRREKRERLPFTIPTNCLGRACIYFNNKECQPTLELIDADGTTGGVRGGPFMDDATYGAYGILCSGVEPPQFVAKKIMVTDHARFNQSISMPKIEKWDLPYISELEHDPTTPENG